MADVRPLAEHDAAGIAACLTRCYGETYPKRVLYDAGATAALIRRGAYGGVVAVSGEDVVGHIGFSRPSPVASVVEAGTTMVDPRHRGAGLMGRMGEQLGAALLAAGTSGFIHFPTTAHTVMQRASVVSGHETGILLAYIPGETRDGASGGGRAGRLAVTVVYQPLGEAPVQRIVVPAPYRGRIDSLAGRLGIERELVAPGGAGARRSLIDHEFDEARSLVRVAVARAGDDFADVLAALLASAPAQLVHVDLALNDPAIGSAVDALRREHFAYAAWLPGWAGHDVLRLQRVCARRTTSSIPTCTPPRPVRSARQSGGSSAGALDAERRVAIA